jgi:uncharacterized protein YpmS
MRQIEQNGPLLYTDPPPPVVRRRRLNLWLGGAGVLLLGIAFGMAATMLFLWLAVSQPLSPDPVPPPTPSQQQDARLTLSQEYINREVAAYLSANPVKVLGVLEVKQVVVELVPGNQVNITARAEAIGRQIDLKLKDNITVKDGQIVLTLAEPVNAGGLQLPFVNLNGIVDNVNVLVANEINKLIAGVGSALPAHKPTLKGIVLSQGTLEATFGVTIGGTPTGPATTPAGTAAPATTPAATTAVPTTAPVTTPAATTATATQ